MRQRIFFVILFVFIAKFGSSQIKLIPDKKGIATFCDGFMQKFVENRIDEAIQAIKEYSAIDPTEIDKLDLMIKTRFQALGDSYGKVLSFEFIDEKGVKDFLLKRIYMLRLEKSCLKFDFRFYNNGKGWMVDHFNYTQQIEDFFE